MEKNYTKKKFYSIWTKKILVGFGPLLTSPAPFVVQISLWWIFIVEDKNLCRGESEPANKQFLISSIFAYIKRACKHTCALLVPCASLKRTITMNIKMRLSYDFTTNNLNFREFRARNGLKLIKLHGEKGKFYVNFTEKKQKKISSKFKHRACKSHVRLVCRQHQQQQQKVGKKILINRFWPKSHRGGRETKRENKSKTRIDCRKAGNKNICKTNFKKKKKEERGRKIGKRFWRMWGKEFSNNKIPQTRNVLINGFLSPNAKTAKSKKRWIFLLFRRFAICARYNKRGKRSSRVWNICELNLWYGDNDQILGNM